MVAFTTPADMRNGWIDRPADVDAFCQRLPQPVFALAARSLMAAPIKDWLGWEQGELALLGKVLPAHLQLIGDCVSHGWSRGLQDQLYQDLANNRSVFAGSKVPPIYGDADVPEIASEPVYALSRIEIGRGQLGRGDGSVGAWACDAVLKYGCLPRLKFGKYDLTAYDSAIAKSWGAPGRGLPDELEPEARLHLASHAALCATIDEAMAGLSNGLSLPICSSVGYTEKRDAQGFCKRSGRWDHCMVARGICTLKGGNIAIPIQQSWGNSPTGGPKTITLESGRDITLPQGVFLTHPEDVAVMLKARDSFFVAGPAGFRVQEPRPVDLWIPRGNQ